MANRLPILGTASVTAGGTTVTWTGDALNGVNCQQGFRLVIAGLTCFVDSLTTTTELELMQPYPGAVDAVGAAASIDPVTNEEVSTAVLNERTATLLSKLRAIDAFGRGEFYLMSGGHTAGNPGAGYVLLDNATPGSVSAIYISDENAQGNSIANYLAGIPGADTVIGIYSIATTAFTKLKMAVAFDDDSGYKHRTGLEVVDYSGSFGADEEVMVQFDRPGATGEGLNWDVSVSNVAARAAYDDEPGPTTSPIAPGFRVLVRDNGATLPRAVIYEKNSNTHADWKAPIYVTGAQGPTGIYVALSDESTIIVTGTAKVTARQVGALNITGVRASLKVASTVGIVQVDIKKNGVSILSTKLSIDASELTSLTAATAPVLSGTTLADDDELTFDILAAGSGAIGLKVAITGTTP